MRKHTICPCCGGAARGVEYAAGSLRYRCSKKHRWTRRLTVTKAMAVLATQRSVACRRA